MRPARGAGGGRTPRSRPLPDFLSSSGEEAGCRARLKGADERTGVQGPSARRAELSRLRADSGLRRPPAPPRRRRRSGPAERSARPRGVRPARAPRSSR